MKIVDEIISIHEKVAAGDERDQLEAALKLLLSDSEGVLKELRTSSSTPVKNAVSDNLRPIKVALKVAKSRDKVSDLKQKDINDIGLMLKEVIGNMKQFNKHVNQETKKELTKYRDKFNSNFKSITKLFKSIKDER